MKTKKQLEKKTVVEKKPISKKQSPRDSAQKKDEGRAPRSKTKAEDSSLPLTSVLSDRELMKRANTILVKVHQAKRTKADAEKEIEEYKSELAAIAMSEGQPGLRYGRVGIEVHGYKTKKTFNQSRAKELMLEHGVPPEDIGECYEESNEFMSTRLVDFL